MIEEFVHDVGFFDVGSHCPDLIIENGDLKGERGLETASLISVFSNQFVVEEDLPVGETDQMGWWADQISEPVEDQIGSKLWTTERSKTTLETANLMEDFIRESFQWMIDDGIALSVLTTSEIVNDQEIKTSTEIQRPDEKPFFFEFLWDGQEAKAQQNMVI